MRACMVIAVMVVVCASACAGDDEIAIDAARAERDGGLDAAASVDGGPAADAATDANPLDCRPWGACAEGVVCGDGCCLPGERCTGGVCRCGAGAACAAGDVCAAGGPVGTDVCGSICCGASGPCPQ